jgi:hypothetical protein
MIAANLEANHRICRPPKCGFHSLNFHNQGYETTPADHANRRNPLVNPNDR